MIRRAAVLGAVVSGFAVSAAAQDAAPEPAAPATQEDETRKAIGALLDRYGTLTGAWIMEQRCDHIQGRDEAELQWHLSEFTVFLARLQIAPNVISMLQNAGAQSGLNEEEYPCGEKTEGIVKASADMAKQLVPALIEREYDPKTALTDAHVAQYVLAETALTLGDMCPDQLAADKRKDLDTLIVDVKRRADASQRDLTAFRSAAQQQVVAIKSCDDQSAQTIAQSLAQIDALGGDS